MYQDAAKSYLQTNVLTANPLRLVLMCYDGAISSLKLARERYEAEDYEAKSRALQKALDIINELAGSLDMKRGGEVARNLRTLYAYMTQALTEADLKREPAVFGRVAGMLAELESSWKALAAGGSEPARPAEPVAAAVPEARKSPLPEQRSWSV
jgi:flagellar protein FliS